ncbi:MAG TPA: hypothetical protein VIH61_04355, partial [Waddliaceae bacterium]
TDQVRLMRLIDQCVQATGTQESLLKYEATVLLRNMNTSINQLEAEISERETAGSLTLYDVTCWGSLFPIFKFKLQHFRTQLAGKTSD